MTATTSPDAVSQARERLQSLRADGVRQIDRRTLAWVLDVEPNSIDAARARARRGERRFIEPDGYLGRAPWWKPGTVARLITLRYQPWNRHAPKVDQ